MNDPLSLLTARRIRPDIAAMHPYAVQDSTGMVKLDAMENPYTLPPELQATLGERLGAVAVNRYPGPRIEALKQALAGYIDLPAGYQLMLGNGSDELISMLATACNLPGACVLAPEPGFVMYAMSAHLAGMAYEAVPLTAQFELDEAAMLAAIARVRPAITYLAYPNNPTANLWDAQVVKNLIAACLEVGGWVVMDEAYQPFSSHTWLDEIRQHPAQNANVLLMRTLSKFGLAGVRLGYLVGPGALMAQLEKVRPPYNVSVLNAECALFALEHSEAFRLQAQAIIAERAMLLGALSALPGVTVFPSDANMILLRVSKPGDAHSAQTVFEHLKANGVLVKNVSKMHALLANCLRITVGTPDENRQLLKALTSVL
jgi:histidinol-phosphate aminotransferase